VLVLMEKRKGDWTLDIQIHMTGGATVSDERGGDWSALKTRWELK